ncbi:MAG: radical SAM protein [Armatimonadetes bacterium]|nr:radical SAM protein [Armatimonadota bacterium]
MRATLWRPPVAEDAVAPSPAACFEAGERNHHISNTAYPIAHHLTFKPYRVEKERQREMVLKAFQGIDDLCLYAHIPFCETRCSYCEYTVVGKGELSRTRAYMDRLNRELELYRGLLGSRTVHGFDIGGGTPSFVEAELIGELVENARSSFRFTPGVVISIETTPRIAAADRGKLEAYKRMGIDRISMGIQVIQPDLLRILNRDGNGVEHHRRAVEHVREAGFEKFNVDLMYGFADQSLESWRATVEHAIGLAPEAITLYRVRYKLTRISAHARRVNLGDVRAQAELAKRLLADAGYLANPGKNTFSRIPGDPGTSDYITRRVVDGMPYLGLGLGAQSFTHATLSYNDGAATKELLPYLRSVDAGRLPLQDLYDLPLAHMMAKMICVSLYFGEIDRRAFLDKFGTAIEDAYPQEVAFALERGLVELNSRALSMSERGARHFNGVVALFHAPSVKRYLLERDPDAADDLQRNARFAEAVVRRARHDSDAA